MGDKQVSGGVLRGRSATQGQTTPPPLREAASLLYSPTTKHSAAALTFAAAVLARLAQPLVEAHRRNHHQQGAAGACNARSRVDAGLPRLRQGSAQGAGCCLGCEMQRWTVRCPSMLGILMDPGNASFAAALLLSQTLQVQPTPAGEECTARFHPSNSPAPTFMYAGKPSPLSALPR